MDRTSNLQSPNLTLDRRGKLFNSYRLYIKSMASLLLKSAEDVFKGAFKQAPVMAMHLREPATSDWRGFHVLDNAIFDDEDVSFDPFDLNDDSDDFLARVNGPSWEQQISELIDFEARLMTLISRAQRTGSTNPYTLMSIRQIQKKYSYVNWKVMLESVLSGANQSISDTTQVMFNEIYYNGLESLLKNSPKRYARKSIEIS